MDSRLFNQEQLSGSFGDDDSYGHFDKPLFSGSSAAAAIYRPRGANIDDDGNEVDAGNEDSINKSMQNDRFGLGQAGKGRGFDGADSGEIRDGFVLLLLLSCSTLTRCCTLDQWHSRRIRLIRSVWTPSSTKRKRAQNEDSILQKRVVARSGLATNIPSVVFV